jgi:hypothetical protein
MRDLMSRQAAVERPIQGAAEPGPAGLGRFEGEDPCAPVGWCEAAQDGRAKVLGQAGDDGYGKWNCLVEPYLAEQREHG